MPRRTKIKICGVMNEGEARRLVKYDVYALGFIVGLIVEEKYLPYKIDLELVAKMIKRLPSSVLSVVGLANETAEGIIRVAQETGTDVVQIQKGGTRTDILKIKEKIPTLRIWKVFYTDKKPDFKKIAEFERISDAILIHSREREWPRGLEIARVLKKPFILAGGLNVGNVKKAIEKFRPFAIDLIRGVETVPGRKDFIKVRRLLKEVG